MTGRSNGRRNAIPPTRHRCARCHSKSAVIAPDGFTDCSACGLTTRPHSHRTRQPSKRELDAAYFQRRQAELRKAQLPLPETKT